MWAEAPPAPREYIIIIYYSVVESGLASINISAERGTPNDTLLALQNEYIEVGIIDESCGQRYHVALANTHRNKGEDLTQDEISKVIEEVNEEVRLERLSKSFSVYLPL